MIVKIVCPVQTTETFTLDVCSKCRFFERNIGAKHPSVSCRKQKTKPHKNAFESAFYSDCIGRPDTVVIEAKEDTK